MLATGNRRKIAELNALLAGLPFRIAPQSCWQVPEAAEMGLSFVENAILKARNATQYTGLPALADDSGLEVDALHGAPGIYSSRYAGVAADDAANRSKLLAALQAVSGTRRTARFHAVVVYMRHPEEVMPLICQGTWEGQISCRETGQYGFGYDPVFYVPALGKTAAELEPTLNNTISHRAKALARLREQLSLIAAAAAHPPSASAVQQPVSP